MKKLLGILLACLLFFNLYLLYKRYKLIEQVKQVSQIVNEYGKYEECYKNVICLNSINIDQEFLLYSKDRAYSLKEIVGEQTHFVFYFSEDNCQKCIIEELQKISSFFPESMKDRILLIENKQNINDRYSNSFNFDYYATNKLLFEKNTLKLLSKYPIFFLIDKDLVTHFVYIPIPSETNLTTMYLTKIKNIINDK